MARLYFKFAGMLVCVSYWVACFTLTHVPLRLKTAPRHWKIPHADKFVHFGLYFLLAILLASVLKLWIGKEDDRSRRFMIPLMTVLLCGTYGIFDEVTQAWVPSRSADLLDWLADLAGTLAGLLAYCAILFGNAVVRRSQCAHSRDAGKHTAR